MSEAQKYQGALYKERPSKNGRKGNNQNQNGNKNNNQQSKANTGHRAPYVEDAPDSQTNLLPTAPTPPTLNENKPTQTQEGAKVNVFDFLVDEKTPNASKVSLVPPKEQMQMKDHAPSVFETSQALARAQAEDDDDESKDYDVAYEEHGFSYGAGPIAPPVYPNNKAAAISMEFMTPAPKKKDRRGERQKSPPTLTATTSEKKRKRRIDDNDPEDADTPMLEAPSSVLNHPGTPMLHSGLTGGLDRMLRSPSLDDEDSENPRRRYQDPSSPLKRTRRDEKEDAGLGISIKNRAERLVSSMFTGSSVSGSSVAGNEAEPRKAKKTHKIRDQPNSTDGLKTKRKVSAQTEGDHPMRRLKKTEYPERSEDGGEVVVYRQENHPDEVQRQMAAQFLSLVTKGPESTRGFSVNKVLKRFHKDFTDEYDNDRGREQGRSRADRERRGDDEKDLWRTLRLKQNERGEIVIFF
ncbi:uncharacterized protein BDV17DRAFT_286856 [Aspergillus undulatus]|uniref:uncharacterized protein n=1 Tax=Aspergillus undulatus TaxID=1810928 RepID=UPI003CCCBEAF